MSRTLNLVDGMLALGRRLLELGQHQQAAQVLKRLTSLRQLPAKAAQESQSLWAEVESRLGEHGRAARHLRVALTHAPACADYHHRLAVALEEDPDGSDRTALRHYQRSLALAPDNPNFLCDYAFAALNQGKRARGLEALRKAVQLAPDDPHVLTMAMRGFSSEGAAAEARSMLRAALFRNPRAASIRQLWNRFQFEQLHQEQQQERLTVSTTPEPHAVILKFTPRRPRHEKVAGKQIRHDAPETLPGPKLHEPSRRHTSRRKR